MEKGQRVPFGLSAIVAIGAAIMSAVGILVPELYRDRSEWLRSVWVGNDYVTLLVAVPVLVVALVLTRQNSLRGRLLWYGAIGYTLYNYAYYLLGARINPLFPAYVVVWVLSTFVLMMALYRLDTNAVAEQFSVDWRGRVSAVYMLVTGVGLAIAWVAQWAGIVFAGVKPNLGEAGFQLVAAMDLSFMVPYFIVGGVLLWQRRPWGYVVSPIILTQGALYTLVLAVNSARMMASGGMGGNEFPVWAGWTACGIAALALLLSSVRPPADKDGGMSPSAHRI